MLKKAYNVRTLVFCEHAPIYYVSCNIEMAFVDLFDLLDLAARGVVVA